MRLDLGRLATSAKRLVLSPGRRFLPTSVLRPEGSPPQHSLLDTSAGI
jgi:hypothetical protein